MSLQLGEHQFLYLLHLVIIVSQVIKFRIGLLDPGLHDNLSLYNHIDAWVFLKPLIYHAVGCKLHLNTMFQNGLYLLVWDILEERDLR